MGAARFRVLGIAPYEGMQSAMERAAEAYPDMEMDVYVGDLGAGADIVRGLNQEEYDCVVSRGGTAERIREVTALPVVEIELSVYDVLRTIKLAGHYSDLYAVVGFPSITEPAHILCDLLRYDMDILTVHSAEEAAETLRRLKQGGYRMVVGDMVTHTLARQMGLDAFLVTSGVEALHAAFEQARMISAWARDLRRENLFLRGMFQGENDRIIVLDEEGELFYALPADPEPELLAVLRTKRAKLPPRTPLKLYHNEQDQLYTILGREMTVGGAHYAVFRCSVAQIPLHSNKSGLRFFNKSECEHLFTSSFYSLSGAMGEMESALAAAAVSRQPVMILGESGTGKEQIARALYLRSPLCNFPYVVADSLLMNDKSWDFLLNHHTSPLNDADNTICFQNFDSIPEHRRMELLSVILDTGLTQRERLIFSCACREDSLPEAARLFSSKLGCLVLHLPTLRSRSDEIPSLASLYLSTLNLELGKQISGFEPRALEQLRCYDWPNNYTQFKGVLYELAALSTSPYIRGSAVAEVLTRERGLNRGHEPKPETSGHQSTERRLDEIIWDAVCGALEANGGNQTAAARQLGISRTTLWRYLKQGEPLHSAPGGTGAF